MSYRTEQGEEHDRGKNDYQSNLEKAKELLSCQKSLYPIFHHSTSLFTGGLVSKACSNSSKTGCICTTPTRPYKS